MARIASQVGLKKIGKYLVLEKIGAGGMGTVYKAEDPVGGQIVAIKVVPQEVATNVELGMRFAQECQVSSKLNHPHIVRVLDFGIDGTRPYLVMEYVEGENLGDKLDRQGPLGEAEAVDLIVQTGQALHFAHQRRLIHRDVKPENILISADGQAKLTDLGLAKNLESDTNLTKTMSFFGTINFMAPEQFEDAKRADALSDLYSLAATLYMALTGELPFRGRSTGAVAAVYKKKLANDIAPPRQLVPEVSERVSAAVVRTLRADRRERPASVPEFLESLTGGPVSSPDASAVEASPEVPEASETERRIAKRFSSRKSTSCVPLQRKKGADWSGAVVNISETGLCLELKRRFEPRSILTVVLEGEGTKRRSLVVRVMWVKKQGPDTWQMGCCFDQPLCPFEVEELR